MGDREAERLRERERERGERQDSERERNKERDWERGRRGESECGEGVREWEMERKWKETDMER